METDTIAAIATGMSNSGIGIIRVSGPEAGQVIDAIYVGKKSDRKISCCPSHTIHYGNIVLNGQILDEVLVMWMKGPNTYTREDTVEINCHGGVYVMRKILEAVLKNGARPAEPGEFTKRAFLNGRIDLSQAEAVIDVINAKNQYALRNSVKILEGRLSHEITKIREELIHEIAFIEAALDDPEHISLDHYVEKLKTFVESWGKQVDKLLKTVENGKLFTQGVQTVILGKPNAGKSSLLNAMAGHDRAIVTDIAGTTRDTLEETINLEGITLNLIDTAGIRNTSDVVEEIGVERAMASAENADLLLYVVDSSTRLDENDEKILDFIGRENRKALVLLNKMDLTQVVTVKELEARSGLPVLSISAKESLGLEQLSEKIVSMFAVGTIDFNDEIYISRERDKASLDNAYESLRLVAEGIDAGMTEDFLTIDLMNAYTELGKVLGEEVEEDLVNEIFSKFCMGK